MEGTCVMGGTWFSFWLCVFWPSNSNFIQMKWTKISAI